jgi:O-antigen/teichoic acid export membrane protein
MSGPVLQRKGFTRAFRDFWSGDSFRKRGRRGSIWVTLGFAAQNALRLLSNLVLTRLLSPEIFGIMALARVVLAGVNLLSDVGTKASVVRSERGEEVAFLDTAWSVQILRGVLITVVTCLIAWPVSLLYQEPVLLPLIAFLALVPLVAGFKSISAATASRNLTLGRLTLLPVISRVVSMCVSIAAAIMLQSVWALALGALAGTISTVVLSHLILPPHRHRLALEPEAFREIIRFGRWIMLGTFLGFLGGKGQQALQGLYVPVETLGLISVAFLFANLPVEFLRRVFQTLLFPSFSKLRRERPQDLSAFMFRSRLVVICGVFPPVFLLAFAAQPLIGLLYDPRYATAGAFLSILALNNVVSILSMPYQNLLLAEGRSDLHAAIGFLGVVGMLAGLSAGYYLGGTMGLLIGAVAGALAKLAANLVIARSRGHASLLLDLAALAILAAFYVWIVAQIDVAPEYWGLS